jgi:hypothetical protein
MSGADDWASLSALAEEGIAATAMPPDKWCAAIVRLIADGALDVRGIRPGGHRPEQIARRLLQPISAQQGINVRAGYARFVEPPQPVFLGRERFSFFNRGAYREPSLVVSRPTHRADFIFADLEVRRSQLPVYLLRKKPIAPPWVQFRDGPGWEAAQRQLLQLLNHGDSGWPAPHDSKAWQAQARALVMLSAQRVDPKEKEGPGNKEMSLSTAKLRVEVFQQAGPAGSAHW